MSDALDVSRLGDLPSVGMDLSTRRQKELHDAITSFMRDIERNRRLLLAIVLEGAELFYKRMHSKWSAFDRDMTNAMYGYFVLQAGANVEEQLAQLNRQQVANNLHWDKRLKTQQTWDTHLRDVLRNVRHEKRKR